ncbi:hypothetical protein [Streptomyces sp. DH12]|uniref:hypothetical protein n=1 Tax=Streptomyces sp. DH12 TaxID=2857010 RepID=UPI001E5840CF|nr:hypothetical protein [Streptomyces sp. DH12]
MRRVQAIAEVAGGLALLGLYVFDVVTEVPYVVFLLFTGTALVMTGVKHATAGEPGR